MKFLPLVALLLWAGVANAQTTKLDSSKPVEITADALEVLQEQQKAIFSGNVIATQGGVNMKSKRMVVHYRNSGGDKTAGDEAGAAQGVSRLEADGGVLFTSAVETAQGSQAVYDVDKRMITMTGDVILTRQKNVLKGTRLEYNLATGRSVLTGGVSGSTGSSGRVRGLFVPEKTGQ